MNDVSNILFIDSHAKSNRGNEQFCLAGFPSVLNYLTVVGAPSSVIVVTIDPYFLKLFVEHLTSLLKAAVHDATVTPKTVDYDLFEFQNEIGVVVDI